ncbi:Phosphoglycerate mutase family protein [Candidatus Syntrophocurvum alkaliphilum]|uniref:Alpha-ribazole phosphatase n=1 Tax=Candidatus Syntrophocurvum alkaliphilum TaxID=2293317 RepID=A0A6I6DMI0_9FIRM|nr:alpha-ribazole phosphatase [Candidatus Syntrophocurvum alkaliphilum]QGU00262.1 Phosphoglycerate mutase family protein [Candidatus Syntrophocurvum alkaliphilum]
MKVFLLRHGETNWNYEQRYQGHTDIPLNDIGKEQARTVGKYLYKKEKIEAIYCSDLSRTKETAEIIADYLRLQVKCDARFREMSFGDWEGKTFTEVHNNYKEEFNEWVKDTLNTVVPGSKESFTQVRERAFTSLEEISKKHNGNVLIVTHGGVIKTLLYYIDPKNDMWETYIQPSSLSIINIENGKFQVISTGITVK